MGNVIFEVSCHIKVEDGLSTSVCTGNACMLGQTADGISPWNSVCDCECKHLKQAQERMHNQKHQG